MMEKGGLYDGASSEDEHWVTMNGAHVLVGGRDDGRLGNGNNGALPQAPQGSETLDPTVGKSGNGGEQASVNNTELSEEEIKKLSLFDPRRKEWNRRRAEQREKEYNEKLASKNEMASNAASRVASDGHGGNSSVVTAHKERQMEIIQRYNPMRDDVHLGIRKAGDIRSFDEAIKESASGEGFSYPDFGRMDAQRALSQGRITIYSSKPIGQGGFVSPSKMMASDYAGSGKVYSKVVPINSVAWINTDEGQYADVGG